jgi:hypothetical protein
MQRRLQQFWLTATALVAAVGLAACSQASADPAPSHEEPAHVEAIEGSELSRVILTEKAAERTGIQTAPVEELQVGGTPPAGATPMAGATPGAAATPLAGGTPPAGAAARKVIPYGALLYDPQGQTWVYVSPEPLVFVRQAVAVERIDGDRVILTEGPEVGTQVVTVGAPELYGTEFGVGH